ncbi:hypothetical protein HBI56_220950 [Parastagonospora nodorum]|nr:hypothetical protein HBH51_246520 [Parastagonospora nodorum]KAH3994020.1 hypothetical protein HBI10_193760 [Parastagonospora nodorum]KAH4008743.1 hypothetical protein HBI13_232210 [Parastagonospora nodorum]KAH4013434.1 hypothetical protein HBI09_214740 [Parastagonospora nodorum]KAH4153331.1 hypothetical protein HBH43_224560 [Parastagonospora nodorum]
MMKQLNGQPPLCNVTRSELRACPTYVSLVSAAFGRLFASSHLRRSCEAFPPLRITAKMFVAAPGNPCKRLRILQEASPVLIKRIIEEGVQASIQQPPNKPSLSANKAQCEHVPILVLDRA